MEYNITIYTALNVYSYHRARYWFQEGWLFIEYKANGKRKIQPFRNDDSITDWVLEECE